MQRELSVRKTLNVEQIVTLVLMTLLVVGGVLIKMERAPEAFERLLDPARLAIPLFLLGLPKLRKKIGVSSFFCILGLICVALTMGSEELRATPGFWLIVPAYVVYAAMIVHASRKAPSPSWAALAVCLALAPVF